VSVDPYYLLNANLSARLSPQVELSLLFNNVLNQEYRFPEYVRAKIPYVPGGPRFNAFARLTVEL